MSRDLFLLRTAVQPPVMPPERWLRAFPDGLWCNWATLCRTVLPGDTIWIAVIHEGWLDRIADLLHSHPQSRVVVLSPVPYEAEGLRAINAGARGYCHLLAVPELLREVAQVVRLGGLWVGPDLVQRLMSATRVLLDRGLEACAQPADLSALSEREAQVARVVAAGKSNREVAEQLHISERTVKAHLGSVFEKLGVRDRVQLVLHLTQAMPQIH
jgi:DNA-binding NarL/FixJ family response regulator